MSAAVNPRTSTFEYPRKRMKMLPAVFLDLEASGDDSEEHEYQEIDGIDYSLDVPAGVYSIVLSCTRA